jgi:hypothetical protein
MPPTHDDVMSFYRKTYLQKCLTVFVINLMSPLEKRQAKKCLNRRWISVHPNRNVIANFASCFGAPPFNVKKIIISDFFLSFGKPPLFSFLWDAFQNKMQSTQNLIVIDIKKSIFLTFFYLRTAAMPAIFQMDLATTGRIRRSRRCYFVDDFL